jgi:ABC-type polysaccharide/polyol phosphate transport system ATPase subunit
VDEVLAAGDMAFREKAQKRMQELMKQASLMVLVSHSLKTVETLCDRVLWMDNGQPRMLGPAVETVAAYREHMTAKAAKAA